jgi:predicted AlkP superfamily pyrophosphatase or phosphodiesterase
LWYGYINRVLQDIYIMKQLLIIASLLTLNLAIFGQNKKVVNITANKPKLVIGLVIDQMRWDYLYKYAANYGNSGFKKLVAQGFSMENTYLNYIPSVTACGHAGIYTGSVPAIHGIASNDWYDRSSGKMMYCTQDNTVNSVGTESKAGKMSPKNMLTTSICDELKLATNFRSKTIGIALKDRGAILPAGHTANAAYWMDDSLGHFITSTHYMQNLPSWVSAFNNNNNSKKYLEKNWTKLLADAAYTQSTADETKYEGKFKTDSNVSFPHKTNLFKKIADIKRTPYGNSITLDFAKEAIINEQLGKDNYTDLLAISLSSTDYIGHQFGIDAIELEDCYYRLDRDIEAFLAFLDKEVGAGNYTIFLTADHGAAHNPIYLQDKKIPAGYVFNTNEKKRINEKAFEKFGVQTIVDMGDNQIWINDSITKKDEAIDFVMNEIKNNTAIQFIIKNKDLSTTAVPAVIKEMAINGYNNKRSGDILLLLNPSYIESYNNATTGTTHGTWNAYDSHIPMLWYGAGIKKGKSNTKVYMHDIASTLAALLQIQEPNGNIGTPMKDCLQ